MNQRSRAFVAGLAAMALFLLVQVGALALVEPFMAAGFQSVENPEDPTNSLFYVGILLVATAAMLVVIKLDLKYLLRGFIVLTSGLVSVYVFSVVFPPVVVSLGGTPVNVAPFVGGAAVALALLVYPEWYVIDAAGVVMGAGAAAIFGISFGVLPAIVLLTVLAVYDAISVYGTEHMLTLASGVMEMKVPVILVIPLTLSYSFIEEAARMTSEGAETTGDEPVPGDAEPASSDGGAGTPAGDGDAGPSTGDGDVGEEMRADGEAPMDRDAFFIGLGDAVMPTIMVASAAFFAPAPAFDVAGLALNLPALTAMVGTMLGLVALLWLVMKGRAHAGLPLLNGGAISGYLVGAVAAGIPLLDALGVAQYL